MENKVKIKVLSSSPEYKVLSISGDAGDILQKHQVNYPALLLVRKGNIIYSENEKRRSLTSGECQNIPADIIHGVICIDKSELFVVLSNSAKMKFEK